MTALTFRKLSARIAAVSPAFTSCSVTDRSRNTAILPDWTLPLRMACCTAALMFLASSEIRLNSHGSTRFSRISHASGVDMPSSSRARRNTMSKPPLARYRAIVLSRLATVSDQPDSCQTHSPVCAAYIRVRLRGHSLCSGGHSGGTRRSSPDVIGRALRSSAPTSVSLLRPPPASWCAGRSDAGTAMSPSSHRFSISAQRGAISLHSMTDLPAFARCSNSSGRPPCAGGSTSAFARSLRLRSRGR